MRINGRDRLDSPGRSDIGLVVVGATKLNRLPVNRLLTLNRLLQDEELLHCVFLVTGRSSGLAGLIVEGHGVGDGLSLFVVLKGVARLLPCVLPIFVLLAFLGAPDFIREPVLVVSHRAIVTDL